MKTKLLVCMLFIASITFSQNVIYVKHDASSGGDGTSWANAYTSLQDALVTANENDEIWVSKGVYKAHASDIQKSFKAEKEGLKIYGGFVGTETTKANRDLAKIHTDNRTILSGDLANNDSTNSTSTLSDNTERILVIGKSALVDGITISGGNGVSGAAIHKFYGANSLIINNCIIENNRNELSHRGAILIDCNENNSVKVTNSIIRNNTIGLGTFFAQLSTPNKTLDITLVNNLFYENEATHFAGSAMWLRADKGVINANIVNNTIVNNVDVNQAANTNVNRVPVGLQNHSPSGGVINTTFANNIVWGNKDGGGNPTTSVNKIYRDADNSIGNITVSNSISEDNFSHIANKTSTSDIDPMLTNEYKLQAASLSAGDKGDNSKIPEDITTDLAGNSRVFNTIIDIGAYEFLGTLNKLVTSIDVLGSDIDTDNGTSEMTVAILPTDATNKTVSWKVDNPEVAIIDETTGILTALNNGTVTVIAEAQDGSEVIGTNTITITNQIISKIFVKRDATGSNDGTSWANAYTSLRWALNNASSAEEIWVAKGTYTVDHNSDRSLSFSISKENLRVYGGFAGNEIDLSERDKDKIHTDNSTVLSADISNNDIGFFGNTSENTRILVEITTSALVDGFTIAGAFNNDSGAAIKKLSTATNVRINNCIIERNQVLENWNGVIFAESEIDATFKVTNCIIRNNKVGAGTVFIASNADNIIYDVTCANNLIYDNEAYNFAGSALWVRANKGRVKAKIINNTIVDNKDFNKSGNNSIVKTPIGVQYDVNQIDALIETVFANNIVWGNRDFDSNITFSVASIYMTNVIGTIAVSNSIGEDNFSNIADKTDTSDADPNLTKTNLYKLQAGSPAIDAGDNSKIPELVTTDLLGNARIHNGTVDLGAYEYGSVPLSTHNLVVNESEFKIYPNPVSNSLFVNSTSDIVRVGVYNILGKKVLETTAKKIDVHSLASGVYILKLENKSGKIVKKKFIKQ